MACTRRHWPRSTGSSATCGRRPKSSSCCLSEAHHRPGPAGRFLHGSGCDTAPKKMLMKKNLERSIAIASMAALATVLFRFFSPTLHHERNSAEVRALYESLHLDMTREQARPAM